MHQFIEAGALALQSIWASKLRSLLTVLGNIVAVTSIIAVVSLVQGLNASVKDAIESGLGAESFTVQRSGRTLTDEEIQRARRNPDVSLDDMAAIRRLAPSVAFVVAEAGAGASAKYRTESLDSLSLQGVSKDYFSLPTTLVERGR